MSVTTIGFKEFEAKLDKLPSDLRFEVDGEVRDASRLWVEGAILAAPRDKGYLSQNIPDPLKEAEMNYSVTSIARYSPYQEWGTGNYVSVPSELIQYALQFKGKKKVTGNKPHPFFFIQRPKVEKFLFDRLTVIVNRER